MLEVPVKEANVGEDLSVTIGESFAINIRNGGTGGATWTVSVPEGIALLYKRQTQPSGLGGMPRGRYVFRCDRIGEYSVNFELKRPWETRGSRSERTVIHCGPQSN